jgi:hypothetical protein
VLSQRSWFLGRRTGLRRALLSLLAPRSPQLRQHTG